ncbi:MAG: hypothetical protein AB1768_16460 [Pseudomonadota bacterium]
MNRDYSRAIPPPWKKMSKVFLPWATSTGSASCRPSSRGERLNVGQIAEVSTLSTDLLQNLARALFVPPCAAPPSSTSLTACQALRPEGGRDVVRGSAHRYGDRRRLPGYMEARQGTAPAEPPREITRAP